MPNAVVGTLRALLTADTAQFEGGMRKAAVVVGQFGQSVQKQTATIDRMAKAFSGERLLAQANNLVAAVNKVGGASKLTANEQARINRTLTDAIAKYKALGQTAPAAMVATEKATRQADTATSKWGMALDVAKGALAAFGITLGAQTIVNFGRQLLTTADQLVKVADRTGLTTTEVQKLQFVAEQSGNSIDDFTGAIGQLQNRLISGDRSAVNAIKVLGLSLQDLKQATPFEQISQIATAIAKVPDPAARAAIAMDLFGRAGVAILPTLISNFNELAEAAPQMSDATVRALDQVGDELNRMGRALQVGAANIFIFLSNLFDRFVIFVRRAVAAGDAAFAAIFEQAARLPGVGRAFADMAKFFRESAQFGRDAARALELGLERQAVEVRKNTTALIDYDALLNRTAGSTGRVTTASSKLLPNLGGIFRATEMIAPSLDKMNTSLDEAVTQLQSYSAAWRDTRVTMDRLITAVPTLNAHIDDSTTIVENASHEVANFRSKWNEAVEGIGERLTKSISDSFGDMLVGLRSFKDGFLNIWRSIQQALSNILSEMLQNFVSGFLKGVLHAMAGSAAGAAIGGGAAAAAGGGAAAGAGSAGAGVSLTALATNPITIAAAAALGLGFLIGKKGVFRGGEEALQVNPRRDQFLAQFGPAGTGPMSGFGILAAQLTAWSGQSGGGPLFSAMRMADTLNEWKAAQSAIVAEYAKHGFPDVQSFRMGGFVPPGVVQPAVLHGGSHGEIIVPLDRPPSTGGPIIVNINANIRAWDSRDVKQAFRDSIIPETKQALLLNTDGLTTAIQRHALGGRR